jgi:hypothetical protein
VDPALILVDRGNEALLHRLKKIWLDQQATLHDVATKTASSDELLELTHRWSLYHLHRGIQKGT